MDANELAYLILQHKYLEIMGLKDYSEDEILKVYNQYFPENWGVEYTYDKKIQLISNAIKQNRNLKDVESEYIQKMI